MGEPDTWTNPDAGEVEGGSTIVRRLLSLLITGWVLIGLSPARAADDIAVCRRGNSPEATAACSRLIQSPKTKVDDRAYAYMERCRAYNRSGEYDQAVPDCDAAIRLTPKDARAHSARCWLWLNKHEYERALSDCNQAIKLDPEYAVAYNNRAVARQSTRDPDGAVADYSVAIKLNPKYAVALSNRCRALSSTDPDRALADCDEAIKLTPQYALGYAHRCMAWFNKRDFAKALADCDTAIKLSPKLAIAYNARGNAKRLNSDAAGALVDYSAAIRLDPKLAIARSNLGLLHESMGQLEEALADFRAASVLAPQLANVGRRLQRVEHKLEAARTQTTTVGPAILVERKPTSAPPSQSNALPTAPNANAAPSSAMTSAPAPSPLTFPRAENRVALVIGNSAYANAGKLPNATRDAEAIAAALRRVGFTTVTMSLDLGREQLNEALKRFADLADRADWAVVYYAGHGLEFGGTNYLVPTDAKLTSDRDIAFEAVALDQVLLAVEGARKLRLIVLDACRDNPFVNSMRRSQASRSIGRGLARIEPEGATLVAYAAKAGQVAQDGEGGNSPFVAALVHYLDTPGLEINFLFRKVRDEVLRATSRRQEPFVYGSLPAEAFYFRQQ